MTNGAVISTLSLITGSIVVVNGLFARADDIVERAKTAVNQANRHQFATVLELYYLDHGFYPPVRGGEALVNELEHKNYIQSRPLDASVFEYELMPGGEVYRLSLKEQVR